MIKNLSLSDRIGVSNNLFLTNVDQVGLIKKLARDFKYVEVELEGIARDMTSELTDFTFAEEIRKISEDTGAIINLHAPYKKVDILVNDVDIFERSRLILLNSAKFAIIMGAKTMTFHPGFKFADRDNPAERKRAMNILEDIGYDLFNFAKHESSDIQFCLENTGNSRPFLVLTNDETQQIVRNTPLRITLDVVHAISFCTTQEEGLDVIKTMASLAGNVHLADMNFPKHIHLPIGNGDLDINAIIKTIESTGYSGAYIVEEIGSGFYGDQYVEKAIEYRNRIKDGNIKFS